MEEAKLVSEERLELAKRVTDLENDIFSGSGQFLVRAIELLGKRAVVRWAAEITSRVMSIWNYDDEWGVILSRSVDAIYEWLDCPCENHLNKISELRSKVLSIREHLNRIIAEEDRLSSFVRSGRSTRARMMVWCIIEASLILKQADKEDPREIFHGSIPIEYHLTLSNIVGSKPAVCVEPIKSLIIDSRIVHKPEAENEITRQIESMRRLILDPRIQPDG